MAEPAIALGTLLAQVANKATSEASLPLKLERGRLPRADLGAVLLDCGAITPSDLGHARAIAKATESDLQTVLRVHRFVSPEDIALGLSLQNNTRDINLKAEPPDQELLFAFGAKLALRTDLLPWRKQGEVTIVVTSRPEQYRKYRAALEDRLGRTRMATAPRYRIERAIHRLCKTSLVKDAEEKVDEAVSCRPWNLAKLRRGALALGVLTGLLGLFAPALLLTTLLICAMAALFASMGLKLAAVIATVRKTTLKTAPDRDPEALPSPLPVVTILVPLFREKEIADKLVRRLRRLRYARSALDVCLIVEAEDTTTHDTLARTELPGWMRVIAVPKGAVQTKPRALNFALDFARGSIIGVYDAEDAPEPFQLHKVVSRFAARGPEVVCLQGMLDFYNPHANWLARCFTIEYATWFRVVLPGLEKLGLVLPLGGTTLFFRRAALEKLQGWDAHNVTEDADLGLRLARHGYRTEILETVTFEEANCAGPRKWIKQRSRWLKGYAMTYGVHMRQPVKLYRDLGAWRFLGMQILFGATLLQFLLAPLLWAFWPGVLGVTTIFSATLPGAAITAIVAAFLVTEVINISVGLLGVHRSTHKGLKRWVPTAYLYFPMATAAVYKAFAELFTKPFYWDKTAHGKSRKSGVREVTQPPPRPQRRLSNGSQTPPKYAA